MTEYAGIDYGMGRTNIDPETGIRYGVISQHSIMPEAMEDMEPDYGLPTCPECGIDVRESKEDESEDYFCPECGMSYWSEEVFPEEALSFAYDKEGYKLTQCLDNDIFVTKSPYYTFAQYCSPCVPGAGNLDTPCQNGPKTYCLGHDWFSDGKAPYPVFEVSTGREV